MTGTGWVAAGIVLILLAVLLIAGTETGIRLYRRKKAGEEKEEEKDEMSELLL